MRVIVKLDIWIAQKTEEALVATMKNFQNDYFLAFARRTLPQAIQRVLRLAMDHDEDYKAFRAA